MSDIINLQRNNSAPLPEKGHLTHGASKTSPLHKFSGKKILIILIVAILCFSYLAKLSRDKVVWRAVFLENNQVYFGKLSLHPFWPTAKLSSIYYLQVGNQIQPKDQATSNSEVKIVKLGSELHGPKDAMFIPVQKIMFYEDLRSDSAVVKTIEDLEKK